jgi:site-specific DNA-methyltransferase (adenine-specific)
MARKPFKGSTIDNVLKNGLGAMNIDATRVPWVDAENVDTVIRQENGQEMYHNMSAENVVKKKKSDKPKPQVCRDFQSTSGGGILNNDCEFTREFTPAVDGRYPSNVIGEVAEGYQKYFYNPKVSRKERHAGFDCKIETNEELATSDGGSIMDANMANIPGLGLIYNHGLKTEVEKIRGYSSAGNNHPTVKPVALMEYLIKLVTPPSTPTLQRKVLDPFNGSGSTGMAAVKLGHHYTGCELDEKYIAISATRIEAWNAPEVDDNPLPDELFGDI